MQARATWVGGSRIVLEDRRGHRVVVDRPHPEGGTDRGTTVDELAALAIAASIAGTFLEIARKRRWGLRSFRIDLESGSTSGAAGPPALEGALRISGPISQAEAGAALQETLESSPLVGRLSQAGLSIRLRAEVLLANRGGSGRGEHVRRPAGRGSRAAAAPERPGAAEHHHVPGAWSLADAIEKLDDPHRSELHDPDALWTKVGLRPGDTVVEVGAGTGFFAIPAARRVSPNGRVFAVDLSAELVRHLESVAGSTGLDTLTPVLSTVASIPLPSGIADVVLLANVLHDVPDATVREAVRLMKPGAQFVNLDWRKDRDPEGPPLSIRLSPEQAARRLAAGGLEVIDRWEPGPRHYAMRLRYRPSA